MARSSRTPTTESSEGLIPALDGARVVVVDRAQGHVLVWKGDETISRFDADGGIVGTEELSPVAGRPAVTRRQATRAMRAIVKRSAHE